MALVKTPVRGYTGFVGADQFINGECEVDDSKLSYYERQGYIIIREGDHAEPITASAPKPLIMPDRAAPKAEWEAFARSIGVEPVEKTKNEIITAVTAAMNG